MYFFHSPLVIYLRYTVLLTNMRRSEKQIRWLSFNIHQITHAAKSEADSNPPSKDLRLGTVLIPSF